MPDEAEKTAVANSTLALASFAVYKTRGASEWVAVSGVSMLPLIRSGDEVLVRFGPERPKRGEIVLFWENGRMVVHRLVRTRSRREGDVLVTRGDGTLSFDRPFPAGESFGIVRACRRTETDALVPIAAGGRRGAFVAAVSAGTGSALDAAQRLPRTLRRPAGKIGRRLAAHLVAGSARVAAWSERT
jgi:Peptidase S24-like